MTQPHIELREPAGVRLASDWQLIPRDDHGVGTFHLPLPDRGGIDVRVTDANGALVAEGGGIPPRDDASIVFSGVPAGGPYEVCVSIHHHRDEYRWRNVLVGDLWVLAGQSNMEGCAPLEETFGADARITMFNLDNTWKLAIPPLHRRFESDARAFRAIMEQNAQPGEDFDAMGFLSKHQAPIGSLGCGRFFAESLLAETGVAIGLIPCAYGGTTLDQWTHTRADEGDATLYGNMLLRIARAGGRVRGVLWYQGESDTHEMRDAQSYAARFRAWVADLRDRLENPDAPILTAQLSRVLEHNWKNTREWELLRETQRRLADELPRVYCVPTLDAELCDAIHIDARSQQDLGERFADVALWQMTGGEEGRRPIRLRRVAISEDRQLVEVVLDRLAGELASEGRPIGFEVRDRDGAPLDMIVRVDLEPDRAVLRLVEPAPEGATLTYAPGVNPSANLCDEEGWPVPGFGPIAL